MQTEQILASQVPEDPVAAQLRAEFDRLSAINKQGFDELGRRGIRFDGSVVVMSMVECLYTTIAEAMGPVEGPRFVELAKLRWEQRLNGEISRAMDQGHKHQLALGGSFTPAMIRELANATGTYGGLGR